MLIIRFRAILIQDDLFKVFTLNTFAKAVIPNKVTFWGFETPIQPTASPYPRLWLPYFLRHVVWQHRLHLYL